MKKVYWLSLIVVFLLSIPKVAEAQYAVGTDKKVCPDKEYTYTYAPGGCYDSYPMSWSVVGGTIVKQSSGVGGSVTVTWNKVATSRYITVSYAGARVGAQCTPGIKTSITMYDDSNPINVISLDVSPEIQACVPTTFNFKYNYSRTTDGPAFTTYLEVYFNGSYVREHIFQNVNSYELKSIYTKNGELIKTIRFRAYTSDYPDCNGQGSAWRSINVYEAPTPKFPTPIPPTCHGGSDGKIKVEGLSGSYYFAIWKYVAGQKPTNVHNVTHTFASTNEVLTISNLPITSGKWVVSARQNEADSSFCTTKGYVDVGTTTQLTLAATPTPAKCMGSATGSITTTLEHGLAPYVFKLYQGSNTKSALDSIMNSTSSSVTFAGLPKGTYRIEALDENECKPLAISKEITEPTTAVNFSYNAPMISCHGAKTGTITATITDVGNGPPFSYSYEGGAPVSINSTTKSFSLTGLAAGNHKIAVFDAKGCSITKTIFIGQPDTALSALAKVSKHNSCSGSGEGAITVTFEGGTAGYTISLTKAGDTSGPNVKTSSTKGSVTYTMLTGGTYAMLVEDAKGCKLSFSNLVVKEPTPLNMLEQAKEHVKVIGGSDGYLKISFSGGTAPYQLEWYEGNTASGVAINDTVAVFTERTGLTAGFYTLRVRDISGCGLNAKTDWLQQTFEIRQPSALLSLTGTATHVLCKNGSGGSVSLTASGGWEGYRYSKDEVNWYPDSTTFRGLKAGTHTFHVKDGKGITASTSVKVNEPALALSASLASTTKVKCFGGSDGGFSLTVSGGTQPYYYSLNGGAWTQGTSRGDLKAGSYTITVKDANDCHFDGSFIAVVEQPAAAVSVKEQSMQQSSCGDPNGSATVTVSGGTGTISVNWYNTANEKVGEGVLLDKKVAGSYKAVAQDLNGCKDSVVVRITDISGPKGSFIVNKGISCHGRADAEVSISIESGLEPVTFLWPDGQTTKTVKGLAAGKYAVTLKDATGCRGNVDVVVSDLAPLSVEAQVVDPSCTGFSDGSISVTATGGTAPYRYFWSPAQATTSVTSLAALSAKAEGYSLTVMDDRGCDFSQTFFLKDPLPVVPTVAESYTICSGQILALDAGYAGGKWEWSGPDGFSSDQRQQSLNTPGAYQVKVTDAKGCTGERSFTITIDDDLLKADFLMVSQSYAGDTVVLIDISWPAPSAIEWQLPQGVKVHQQQGPFQQLIFQDKGTYSLGLKASLAGCTSLKQQSIEILDFSLKPKQEGSRMATAFITATASPNPTSGEVLLQLEFASKSTSEVYLLGLGDQRLYQRFALPEGERVEKKLNLQGYPSGIYVIMIKAAGHTQHLKIIKN